VAVATARRVTRDMIAATTAGAVGAVAMAPMRGAVAIAATPTAVTAATTGAVAMVDAVAMVGAAGMAGSHWNERFCRDKRRLK